MKYRRLLVHISLTLILLTGYCFYETDTTPRLRAAPLEDSIGEQRINELQRYKRVLTEKLPNGLKLLVIEIPSSTIAYGIIAVKVGGRYEPDHIAGISHLLEHLLFKEHGQRRPLTQIRETGGTINAMTDMECTIYYFSVLPENYEIAMDALARMTLHPQFTLQDLESEREVVLEELAMSKNDPRALVITQLVKKIFPNSPFTNFVIGTKKSINHITLEDLKKFHGLYYVSQNIIVIAAGNVDAEKALMQMKFLFGDEKHKPLPATNFEVPKPAINRMTKKIPINQTFYVYGALTPGKDSGDYHAMGVLDALFGSGVNSRLYRRIVIEEGFTEQIYPNWYSYSNTGVWALFLSVKPDDLEDISSLINDEMRAIQRGEFTEKELLIAKKALIARIRLSLDRPKDLAAFQLDNLIYRNRVIEVSEYLDIIGHISKNDVIHVARSYFSPENTVTIEMKPAKGPEKLYLILKFLMTKSI